MNLRPISALFSLRGVSLDLDALNVHYSHLVSGIADGHEWLAVGSDLYQQKLVLGAVLHRRNSSFKRHALKERVVCRRLGS